MRLGEPLQSKDLGEVFTGTHRAGELEGPLPGAAQTVERGLVVGLEDQLVQWITCPCDQSDVTNAPKEQEQDVALGSTGIGEQSLKDGDGITQSQFL